MKKIFVVVFLFVANLLFAQNMEDVLPGRVRVKLKASANAQMIIMVPGMKTQGAGIDAQTPEFSIGLHSLDILNKTYKASSMTRVFPHAGKYEPKQERYGLHLWYDILVDPQENPVKLAQVYAIDGNIELAEPVMKVKLARESAPATNNIKPQAAFPNDPQYGKQWHYNNTGQAGGVTGVDIRLPAAWERTKGRSDVIVAVLDQGVEYNHEDLASNMWINQAEFNGVAGVDDDGNGYIDDIYGFNFLAGYGYDPRANPTGPAPIIPGNHGTHVAGTIAAKTNNAIGLAGIAGGDGQTPGAKIMTCQILAEGISVGAYIGAAMAYAANNGAVILQNSWGPDVPGPPSQSVLTAIKYFIANAGTDENGHPLPGTPMVGGIVIFAAGNSNDSGEWYPARHDEVLAVAAIDNKGKRAVYSNYGNWVDISAPGGDTRSGASGGIYSTLLKNTYGAIQGTSMACPHVSGVAALILSQLGSDAYTPDMLRQRLLSAVNPLNDEPFYANGWMGSGLLDASQAVVENVPLTGISLPATSNVYRNRITKLTPIYTPSNATDKRLTWIADNENIATVNSGGTITGVALGSTTITAISMDGSYTAKSVIAVLPVPIEDVWLEPANAIIKLGESQQMTLMYTPTDANIESVVWNSANNGIATIDNNGILWSENLGTTTVSANVNYGAKITSTTVTIVKPVTGVSVEPDMLRMLVGDNISLQKTIIPSDAYNQQVLWMSSNAAIADVNNMGVIQAKKSGNTDITVRCNDGGYTASCAVTVYDAIQTPEGFSPNHDGINDYFELVLDSREKYTLNIFDKSGQMYYQSTDYRNNWDGLANAGHYSGSKVPVGTYFYMITGNTSGSKKSGYVVIKY